MVKSATDFVEKKTLWQSKFSVGSLQLILFDLSL